MPSIRPFATRRSVLLAGVSAAVDMGEGDLDEARFESLIARDNATFRALIQRLGIKPA